MERSIEKRSQAGLTGQAGLAGQAGRVKNGRPGRYLALAFISFAAITGIFLLTGNVLTGKSRFKAIEIANASTGMVYGRLPIEDGGEFAIEFIHSVNNSPVRETFKVEGKRIKPEAVRFFSFGAGMQTELEEGMSMSRDGDAMIITGFPRAFGELNYIIGTVSDHLLLLDGQIISLREMCGKNAHVTIRVRN